MGGPRVNEQCCPHCGQSMRHVRYGVRINPMQARIFDLVKSRPGIGTRELVEAVYGFHEVKKHRVITSRIAEMNGLFAATDIRVAARPKQGYRIFGLPK